MATTSRSATMALTEAYIAVANAEKGLVTSLDTLLKDLTAALVALEDSFPAEGATAPARQLLGRVKSAIMNVTMFDLPNTKTQYGLDVPVVPATDTATA